MIRCIIAGGRAFNDYALMKRKLDAIFANQSCVEIVSGGASGADSLGERYAQERGWPMKRFPADWDLGRRAGPLRNAQMVAYATHLVAFPGGRGTADCVNQARGAGLLVRVIREL
ncbi:DUF2493 domain-containing protein [Halomonas sp. S3-1-1]|uniref:DUF2493 domain-containing protein n=1 Tax=unclassified Halomonas TaxID=2609666 RepID=UPI00336C2490